MFALMPSSHTLIRAHPAKPFYTNGLKFVILAGGAPKSPKLYFNGTSKEGLGMAGVSITRADLTSPELHLAAGRTKDARAARRIRAIALVLEGINRTTAARTCGMDRQTLRDWVHRYNAEGLAGLSNRRGTGRPRRLTPEQMTKLAGGVEAGPDPEQDGVVRWRRKDLARRIEAEFLVVLHERTVGKQLVALGFHRLSVRTQYPKSDPAAQDVFRKTFLRR